jgi:GTP-binding protein HflX
MRGLDELQEIFEEILRERKILMEKVFSYQEAGKIQIIRKYGQLLCEEYKEEGIYVKAYVPKEIYNQIT